MLNKLIENGVRISVTFSNHLTFPMTWICLTLIQFWNELFFILYYIYIIQDFFYFWNLLYWNDFFIILKKFLWLIFSSEFICLSNICEKLHISNFIWPIMKQSLVKQLNLNICFSLNNMNYMKKLIYSIIVIYNINNIIVIIMLFFEWIYIPAYILYL